jgi:hypothetical protein
MMSSYQIMRSAAEEPRRARRSGGECADVARAVSTPGVRGVPYLCTGEAFRSFGALYLESGQVREACGERALRTFASLTEGLSRSAMGAGARNSVCAGAALRSACGPEPAPRPADCFCALNTFCAESQRSLVQLPLGRGGA